jgi:nucleoside 2-deoxyribosyltransferase
MFKVYVAGPDVFSESYKEFTKTLITAAKNLDLDLIFPVNPDDLQNYLTESAGVGITSRYNGPQSGVVSDLKNGNYERSLIDVIAGNCERMMNECDGAIINANPFRGQEPDSGTMIELGYLKGTKKPIVTYADKGLPEMADRIKSIKNSHGALIDDDGYYVEQLGSPFNPMVTGFSNITIEGDAVAALTKLKPMLASFYAECKKPERIKTLDELAKLCKESTNPVTRSSYKEIILHRCGFK